MWYILVQHHVVIIEVLRTDIKTPEKEQEKYIKLSLIANVRLWKERGIFDKGKKRKKLYSLNNRMFKIR